MEIRRTASFVPRGVPPNRPAHFQAFTYPLATRGSSRTRKFEILARFINFCWFFFKWGLALGLVAAALLAVPYFYRHVDDTIRRRVETLFAEHYPELAVSVRTAELVENGILVRSLRIDEREADGPRAELAYIDEMLLVCETDLPTLLRSTPEIREIVVRRPKICATRRPDGQWSTARLFPLPKFSEQPPEITIENASLELFDPQKNPTSNLALREGHLKVSVAEATDVAAGTAAGGRRPMKIRGYLAGDHMQRVEIDGTFDPAGGAWDFSGKLEGLEITPELVHALPGDVPPQLTLLESLRGQAKGDFHVRYAAAEEPKLTFLVTGQLVRGRVDDPRLPSPLTDLRASFRFDEQKFAVDDLNANSGPATMRLDFERAGYGENRPLVLVAEARHLKLDQLDPKLREMFPDTWREAWFKFMPSGEVDLDVKLAYDGRTWQPDVSVQCHDVAFSYHRFPYRLEHGTGKVTLKHDATRKDNVLTVGVTAFSGVEEVRIDGEVQRPGDHWAGHLQVRSRNLPLDDKLLRALPERPRGIVHLLRPNGNINVLVDFRRDERPNAQPQKYIRVDVNNCSVNYELFPYPLSNVHGMLEIVNDDWELKNFEGTNDTARVRCFGHLKPTAEGSELVLNFTGDDVPLEEELRDALAPAARRLWTEVKPQGMIHLDAQVHHLVARNQTRIWVRAEPLGDTTSIEPIQFPYRLDKVRGVFTYENGHLEMENLRAEHGHDTRVSGRGSCDIDPRGGWRLQFKNLSAGRLHADRDLLQALPPRLRKAVTKLNLSGPLQMSGALDLVSSGLPEAPLQSSWNLDFDLQQVGLHCGVPVDNINGRVNLTGVFDGHSLGSQGELAIDSLTYKDFQFTDVRGPFSIDDRQVLFGVWATPVREGQPKRQITTRMFGGYAVADGWVTLEEVPRYNLDAKLAGADLARCAQECAPGSRRLRGSVAATVNLHGQGPGINQLAGGGAIRLTDADVYDLPVMAQLLKIVSARAPDANAFDKSDIDFRIQGEHVYFPRIDFNGDAISLRGTGEMGLDKSIRLEFYTVLGRDEFRIPLVSDVFGGASQGLLKIYVGGTLSKPDVRKQALPMLSEPLQQIQADLKRSRGATGATATGARPLPSRGALMPQRK